MNIINKVTLMATVDTPCNSEYICLYKCKGVCVDVWMCVCFVFNGNSSA